MIRPRLSYSMGTDSSFKFRTSIFPHVLLLMIFCFSAISAFARNPYKTQFMTAYPSAVDSSLDKLSGTSHCGVCHFAFTGGGPRNPYGLAVEATDRSAAQILALGPQDSDTDGYSNTIEITDLTNYVNTPTFPGLKASNVGSVTGVPPSNIQDYLTPHTGADTTPPVVTVVTPNGGQTLTANASTTIQWTATDTGRELPRLRFTCPLITGQPSASLLQDLPTPALTPGFRPIGRRPRPLFVSKPRITRLIPLMTTATRSLRLFPRPAGVYRRPCGILICPAHSRSNRVN